MCLICIFIFCFHFQKIWSLKICLVWLIVFYFQEIKTLKIYDILTYCIFLFLDFLKITFLPTGFLFYPKWGLCFQLKTRFYCFHFLVVSCIHFHWKCFQKSNQTHFHHHFLFSMKMKTKNNQTKHSLRFSLFVYFVLI